MIKIVAKTLVREECVEEFKTLARELVEKSRAEAGNISYSLNQSLADPRTFAIIEMWQDRAVLKAHSVSEHFTRIAPQLGKFAEQSFPMEMYTELF